MNSTTIPRLPLFKKDKDGIILTWGGFVTFISKRYWNWIVECMRDEGERAAEESEDHSKNWEYFIGEDGERIPVDARGSAQTGDERKVETGMAIGSISESGEGGLAPRPEILD